MARQHPDGGATQFGEPFAAERLRSSAQTSKVPSLPSIDIACAPPASSQPTKPGECRPERRPRRERDRSEMLTSTRSSRPSPTRPSTMNFKHPMSPWAAGRTKTQVCEVSCAGFARGGVENFSFFLRSSPTIRYLSITSAPPFYFRFFGCMSRMTLDRHRVLLPVAPQISFFFSSFMAYISASEL